MSTKTEVSQNYRIFTTEFSIYTNMFHLMILSAHKQIGSLQEHDPDMIKRLKEMQKGRNVT